MLRLARLFGRKLPIIAIPSTMAQSQEAGHAKQSPAHHQEHLAWRPQPLPSNPRWYDHVSYWPRRLRDVIAGGLIFIMPPGLAFLIYENFARKPWATFWVALLIGAIWLFAATMAYVNGRED